MGDHPELETDEGRRAQPARRGDRLSPLVIVGIVALIILVAFVLILVLI